MKRTLLNVALLNFVLVSGLFAEDGKIFAEHKTKIIQRIEQHLNRLAEHKNCVSAATKKEDIKACHESMKAWRAANRPKRDEEH